MDTGAISTHLDFCGGNWLFLSFGAFNLVEGEIALDLSLIRAATSAQSGEVRLEAAKSSAFDVDDVELPAITPKDNAAAKRFNLTTATLVPNCVNQPGY